MKLSDDVKAGIFIGAIMFGGSTLFVVVVPVFLYYAGEWWKYWGLP